MPTSQKKRPYLGPNLYWRGNIIWMRSTQAGNPFNESTGTANVREARAIVAARLAGGPSARVIAEDKNLASPDNNFSIHHLKAWHLNAIRKRSDGHKRGVTYAWDTGLVPYFDGSSITNLRPHDLLDYAIFRMDEDEGGVSGNTTQREIQFLRRALRYHVDHLDMTLRVPPKPDKAEFELYMVNASQAGAHIEDQPLVTLYDAVSPACRRWMLMLLATGMRQAELRRVQRSWLRRDPLLVPSGGVLALPAWATKTKRARTLSLPEWAYQAFLSGPLPFTYHSHKVLRAAAKRTGLPEHVFPHDRSLRKTFASRAKEETGDPVAVDIAAGHKARGTQGRYQDLTEFRAFAVGRAISVRFQAMLATLDLPHEVWPDLANWAQEQARRRAAAGRGLVRGRSKVLHVTDSGLGSDASKRL